MRSSPTQRTLAHLRALPGAACVVEKWVRFSGGGGVRVDAFGFGDILWASRENGIVLVQACAGASHADRRAKVLASGDAKNWLACGGRILILSWSKKGERGRRKLWAPRAEWVTRLSAAASSPPAPPPELSPPPAQEEAE